MRRIDREEDIGTPSAYCEASVTSTEVGVTPSIVSLPIKENAEASSIDADKLATSQNNVSEYSQLRRAFRIPGVEGFRFAAHVWVLAFHCLPHPEVLDRLKRNGDAGVFFVLTGMATEISLELLEIRTAGLSSHDTITTTNRAGVLLQRWAKFTLYWFRNRIMKISILSSLAALIAYLIFPIDGGQGRYIMPYAVSLTIAFLEKFNKDRIVWNPNPVMWFCSNIVFFWILHPPLLRPMIRFLSHSPTSLLELGAALYICLIAACKLLEPYSIHHTGWSFHPIPRLLQYICGVYVARFVIISKTTHSPEGWLIGDSPSLRRLAALARGFSATEGHLLHRCLYWTLNFAPDMCYIAQILMWSNGPERYAEAWQRLWIWKSLCATPIHMLCLIFLAMQRDLHSLPELKERGEQDITPQNERSPAMTESTIIAHEIGTPQFVTPRPLDETHKRRVGEFRDDHERRKLLDGLVPIPWKKTVLLLWKSFISHSPLYRLFTQQWSERVAPRMVNFLVFLLHFPLSWQFDRNKVISGRFSIAYCFVLWLLCLTVDNTIALLTPTRKS